MNDREQKSIERIKMASEMSLSHYKQPLIVTYSGGKDSDVMLELFKRSGVPFEAMHSHTTVDAPPTIRHIQEVFHNLEVEGIPCYIDFHEKIVDGKKTRTTMWNLIPQKLMPPTRVARYCCSELKESGGGASNDCNGRSVGGGYKPQKKPRHFRVSGEKQKRRHKGFGRKNVAHR